MASRKFIWNSRKFWIVVIMLICSTAMTVIPPVLGWLYGHSIVILTGAEYVTVCSLIINGYLVANVIQKRGEIRQATAEGED